ncbi:hypothetical protein Tdes44962_MAKER10110, partial [Teratosphaeria destructans]
PSPAPPDPTIHRTKHGREPLHVEIRIAARLQEAASGAVDGRQRRAVGDADVVGREAHDGAVAPVETGDLRAFVAGVGVGPEPEGGEEGVPGSGEVAEGGAEEAVEEVEGEEGEEEGGEETGEGGHSCLLFFVLFWRGVFEREKEICFGGAKWE